MLKTPNAQRDFNKQFVRERVQERLSFEPADHDGDFILNPEFRDWVMSRAVKDAAVMIAMVERDQGLHMVLTKRTEHLSSHSGQVAFPGGKIDPEDENAVAAAIRESEEEINVGANHFDIIGEMPPYYSGSGFKITPVLSFMEPAADPQPNPNEVDYVFEVPMSFLMDEANHIRASRMFEGKERHYLEMPYGDHYIWGVTAGIIKTLHDRIFK